MNQNIIASEDFDLTPAIREHVDAAVATITESLPKRESVSTFLAHPNKREFTTLMKVHAYNREIVAKAADEDLYRSVTKARGVLLRRLHDTKEKMVGNRRSNPAPVMEDTI